MSVERKSGLDMAGMASERATPMERLIAWIRGHERSRVSIEEFFGEASKTLGLTEIEVSQGFSDGLSCRRLAITGLADYIQVRDIVQS